MPITPARVAWYVTGRFYEDEKKQITQWGVASKDLLATFGRYPRIVAFTGSAITAG